MEYKTRFHTHMIVGYSMHKIEAAAHFLHLPRGFYIYRVTFAFAARLLHFTVWLLHFRVAFTFATWLLHFAARLLNAGAGDPSWPPYLCEPLQHQLTIDKMC